MRSPCIVHARVRLATDTLSQTPHRAGALCTGYTPSISLITEPCKTAHIAAAKAAKDAGVLVSYDPNLRLPLWSSAEDARDGILSIWETADVIKVASL